MSDAVATTQTSNIRPDLTFQQWFKYWLLAFRPKTLTAAFVPIVVATALVYSLEQKFEFMLFLLALLSSFGIQIATNLVNDAVDFKKGADTHERLGPQRVTQSGVFTAKQVWTAAILFLSFAVVTGLPLVLQGGLPILYIGLLSLFFAYGYTGGPLPLAYLGLGDLFVVIFFGLIAIGGFAFILVQAWLWQAAVAGLQIGLLAAVLIAINNLRDHEQDARVGKKTLAVRLGLQKTRYLIASYIFLPSSLGMIWVVSGHYLAAILPLLALPLAIKLIRNIFSTSPSREYNRFLGQAAGLHLVFGLLLALGFLFEKLHLL